MSISIKCSNINPTNLTNAEILCLNKNCNEFVPIQISHNPPNQNLIQIPSFQIQTTCDPKIITNAYQFRKAIKQTNKIFLIPHDITIGSPPITTTNNIALLGITSSKPCKPTDCTKSYAFITNTSITIIQGTKGVYCSGKFYELTQRKLHFAFESNRTNGIFDSLTQCFFSNLDFCTEKHIHIDAATTATIGILSGTITQSTLIDVNIVTESVSLRAIDIAGGFSGNVINNSILVRCSLTSNSKFKITTSASDKECGGYIGYIGIAHIQECKLRVKDCKCVFIGTSGRNMSGTTSNIGGFCGRNDGVIKCSSLCINNSRDVVIGVDVNITTTSSSTTIGCVGSDQTGVYAGVGGFVGLNTGEMSGVSLNMRHNCSVIVGSRVVVGECATLADGSLISVLLRGSGVGGFVGCVAKGEHDHVVEDCNMIYWKNNSLVIGFVSSVMKECSNSFIASTARNALCGIGGFYGYNNNFSKIVGCKSAFEEGGQMMCGFYCNALVGALDQRVGVYSFNDGVTGFGGFGGLTILDSRINASGFIEKCELVVRKNGCVGLGSVSNVQVEIGAGGDTYIGYMKALGGVGGFFGNIVTYSTPFDLRECVATFEGNDVVTIGIVANVPSVISNPNVALLSSGAGIGGFCGASTRFNVLATIHDCAIIFKCNKNVSIGSIYTNLVAFVGAPQNQSGIGGFCGYTNEVTIDPSTNHVIFIKNKEAMLMYKTSPPSRVFEDEFIGFSA